MPESFTMDDLEFANAVSKAIWKGDLGGAMNAYERTVISKFMNIEYGSGASIEQLTMAYGYFGATVDKIKSAGYDVPSDLQAAFDACDRNLKIKIKDYRLKEIKALELKRDQLLSADEKRAKIDLELARLKELVK